VPDYPGFQCGLEDEVNPDTKEFLKVLLKLYEPEEGWDLTEVDQNVDVARFFI